MGSCSKPQWIASFAFSPQCHQIMRPPHFVNRLNHQTIRNIVRLTLGGESLRIRISNRFGDKPLTIDAASVGLKQTGAELVAGTLNPLSFAAESGITIPVGAEVYSDEVALKTSNNQQLAISLFIAGYSPLPTIDDVPNRTSYLSAPGAKDATNDQQMSGYSEVDHCYFTTGVDVRCEQSCTVIAAIGTSISDGFGSEMDAANNYPSILARRLQEQPEFGPTSVINTSMSGNRLYSNAPLFGPCTYVRFEPDILSLPGITHVIFESGINDFLHPRFKEYLPLDPVEEVTAAQMIALVRQLIIKAHDRNIKFIGTTITPIKGSPCANDEAEQQRQIFNQWVRTSGELDAYIDFDLVLRDPDKPQYLRSDLCLGDLLHPNPAGYRLMAESIDLELFK